MTKKYYLGNGAYDEGGYNIYTFTDDEVSKIARFYDPSGYGFIDNDGNVYKQMTDQGLVYKHYKAFNEESSKIPCYVPELSDEYYFYKDFLNECEVNKGFADYIFDTVDWQSPGALVGDISSDSSSWPEFFDKDGKIKK